MVIPTLLGITLISFLLLHALPGDPAQGMVGERADTGIIQHIRREIGTDQPLVRQYVGYLKLLGRGELGRSYYTNRRVTQDIAEKLPNTARLAGAAMLFAVLSGLALGTIMAAWHGSCVDRIGLLLSTSGISMPVFWLGLLLIYLCAFKLELFPPCGMGNGSLIFLVLPAMTLGLNSCAYLARVTRTCLLETLSQPYIVTARAKGLRGSTVILKHALKNTLIPVITLVGLDFGSYLNGSVLTETIFAWDGIGRYAVDALFRRDYPVIMGCVVVGAGLFVMVNLIVDLLYGLLDPRIRRTSNA
jgi:ABC-type dipeptide/oligopeptide/nickel transport system permease component